MPSNGWISRCFENVWCFEKSMFHSQPLQVSVTLKTGTNRFKVSLVFLNRHSPLPIFQHYSNICLLPICSPVPPPPTIDGRMPMRCEAEDGKTDTKTGLVDYLVPQFFNFFTCPMKSVKKSMLERKAVHPIK